jgi:putative ABC transport system substrate-binding protein
MKQLRISDFEFRIGSTALYILAVALGLFAALLAADAQQPGKVYRIGGLGGVPPATPVYERDWGGGFSEGLRASGYIPGQHFVMEYRWTDKPWEEARSQAAELVSLKVDLILAVGNLRTRAVKEATSAIPIVMVYSNDPVGFGLVASLARPGGNVTGLTFTAGPELAGKQLELLKEAFPKLSRVAVLWASATFFSAAYLRETEAAARELGLTLQSYEIRDPKEFEGAFAAMTKARAEALLLPQSDLNFANARRIGELAAKSQLPTVHGFREAVEAGGLIAYATNAPAMFHRAATYVDKIFKGANPGDLPVEQPTKFDLIINLKTAKALGLTIPQSLLMRADQVIE